MGKFAHIIDWILTSKCNLNCYYCLQGGDSRNDMCSAIDVKSIPQIEDINLFHLTGGEPFIVPNFIDVCNELLLREQVISINTNLTIPVEKFIKNISPINVLFVNASVHYHYRKEHMKPFLRNYNLLKEAGFFVYATVVMIPEMFDEIADFILEYHRKGLLLFPKLMRGQTGGNRYPDSYTDTQWQTLNLLVKSAKANMNQWETERFDLVCGNTVSIDDWWSDSNKISGTRCVDGNKYIRVTDTGEIVYCNNKPLGNFYKDRISDLGALNKCPDSINNICLKGF